MRLLFDENLSETLVAALASLYPESLHVRLLGLGGASDLDLWSVAAREGCMLVTRDEDFIRLSILRGAPPKVVWIGLGNCSNKVIVELLRARRADIERFAAHEEATFLALGT